MAPTNDTELLRMEIKHLRELRNMDDKARQLQAKEYERRLEALNGEAGRLRNMQESYLPREMFEEYKKITDAKVGNLEIWKGLQQGRQAILLIVYGAVIAGITLLIQWLTR